MVDCCDSVVTSLALALDDMNLNPTENTDFLNKNVQICPGDESHAFIL